MKYSKTIWTAAIVSLLSIITFAYFILNINDMLNMAARDKMSPNEVSAILSRTFTSLRYLLPFIGQTIILVINISIAAFLTHKKVTGWTKWFKNFLFVLGGLGIPFIILMFNLKRDVKSSTKTSWWKITTGGLVVVSPVALFVAAFAIKGVDAPTKGKAIEWSLNADAPNLLEIFTDGFDEEHIDPLLNGKYKNQFKGFVGFNKFITPGFLTNDTVPTILSGDIENTNPFMMKKKSLAEGFDGSVLDYQYIKGFAPNMVKQMNRYPEFGKDSQRSIINPIDATDTTFYSTSNSGTPSVLFRDEAKYMKETKVTYNDDKFNIVNWGQAKDDEAGKFGIQKSNFNNVMYDWLDNHSNINSNAKTGAYVHLNDVVTHAPSTADLDGTLSFSPNGSKYEVILNQLSKTLNNLDKEGVLDNTMVIIYGDHADHDRAVRIGGIDNGEIGGNRSYLLVRYPHSSGNFKSVYDATIYASDEKQLISNYFTNQGNNKSYLNDNFGKDEEIKWIRSNKNFKVDRPLWAFHNNHIDSWKTKFIKDPSSGNWGYSDREMIKKHITWDEWEANESVAPDMRWKNA